MEERGRRPHYVDIIICYLSFVLFYSWGCQLSLNMFLLARKFIKKKQELRPGNVKKQVIMIKKKKAQRSQYKERLRVESNRNLNNSGGRQLEKFSKRELALLKRNIGDKNEIIKQHQLATIRDNLDDMTERRRQGQMDLESQQSFIPVSQRKNDVLFISARDISNPETMKSVRNFEIMKYKESNREIPQTSVDILRQISDPSGTDDEKNVDDNFYDFQPIEEASEDEGVLSAKKNNIRRHNFLGNSKDNKFPGIELENLGRKESYNSERYHTPRNNMNGIDQPGFLDFEINDNLDSIKEVEKEMPLPPVKSDKSKKLVVKRPSLERSYKFDFNTNEEVQGGEVKSISDSVRKLQNNIKMEFLEDIEFGSSILKKSSVVMKNGNEVVSKGDNDVGKIGGMEQSNMLTDFFKKKEVKKLDDDFLIYQSNVQEK